MRYERALELTPGVMVAIRKGPAWEALPAWVLPAPQFPTLSYVVEKFRRNYLAVQLQVPSGFMGLPEIYAIGGEGWSRRVLREDLAEPTDVWVPVRCVIDEEVDQERAVAKAAQVAAARSKEADLERQRLENHQALAGAVRELLENTATEGRVSIDTGRTRAGELVVVTSQLDRVGEMLGCLLSGRQVTVRVFLTDQGALPAPVAQ